MGRPAVTTISCARCSANEKPSNICSTQHIINCQFSRWYSPLKRHTPRARILTSLPTEFLEYLTKDAIVLNPDHDNIHTDHDNHLDHTSEQSSGNSSEQDSFNRSTNLREFNQLITNTIDELGGAVVPKLNWSSPKDTTWMMPGNTMKCTCTNDVLMLLKSSDFCSHDLHHPFDDTSDYVPASDAQLDVQYELVLKEWFDLNPALEFRVFVWDNHLVAISQREEQHYEFLADMENEIRTAIEDLHHCIAPVFPDHKYILDVYYQTSARKARILDINPFAKRTDPLLYSWNEILELCEKLPNKPELRLMPDEPLQSRGFYHNQVPLEMVYASEGYSIAEFQEKWQSMLGQGVIDRLDPQYDSERKASDSEENIVQT